MTVPLVATYSLDSLVAAHTAFAALVDGGAGAGLLRLRDAADALLVQLALTDPCCSISGTTGRLTFGFAATSATAAASGNVAYGEFCDSTGAVKLALPAQAGGVPVSGWIVLNSLTVVAAGSVEITSATIG